MPLLPNPNSTPVSTPENEPLSVRPSSPPPDSPQVSDPEMLNYLWIPFLLSLSKEFVLSKASELPSLTSLLVPSDRLSDSSCILRCPLPNPELNYNPIIGILSHPGDGASGRLKNGSGVSYIAASYVKFVESAGARVVPLIYNEMQETLFEKLSLVNGLIFTGGRVKTGQYFNIVQALFRKAIEINDKGQHFPIYAICLGFELLSMIISEVLDHDVVLRVFFVKNSCLNVKHYTKDKQILDGFNCANQGSTLLFTENVDIEGTVFQRFPPELLKKLQTDCLAMQVHSYGITPSRFQENNNLSSFFRLLTTSKDLNGKEYVSTVQARSYPITGFQWHPEKNAFEWGKSMIPHSEDAVQVTQHAANYFISEARKSSNRPSLQKVLDNLIYNFSPTYCGKAGYGYDEVYIFEQKIVSKCPNFV